ncbi:MAG: 2-oxoacid:acceptor oxidoreductase subunit alpha [Candidatus Bathyarchaeota archaeon]|nr:2-oxoacid:acceptor oxidoreductase subunit alpha [Candidatus Bathyarchaeota archaeon]MDW8040365.1 2-oxoacid:acceptor oxidoreductase subunit alpha [Nitrososphaerota archaeon]
MSSGANKIIEPGTHFLMGNEACALGAVVAGCKFFAFYPITPANEIAEYMSVLLPKVKGIYIQMEDEISSIASVIGASWAGRKAMTATSGPGFTLMQENIGYAVATETPCVIVDVQRCGPSTGTPPLPMQGDVYQAKYGSHSEYPIIALAPSSVKEMFTLTIESFNLAEKYRTPVILLSDALVGHLMETFEIPDLSQIEIVERKKPDKETSDAKYFLDEDVAPMPVFGCGYKAHVTGSTHDEKGLRNVEDPVYVDKVVRALHRKIEKHKENIVKVETKFLDDAEIALLTYGSVARTAIHVVNQARKTGIKVGIIRLITLWPFPDVQVQSAARKTGRIVVMENNLGQVVNKVSEVAAKYADVKFLPPRIIGSLHEPEYVINFLKEVY